MIVSAFKNLFQPPKKEAHEAYVCLIEQSRLPFFYAEQKVADTLDGRFDVIVLHLFLLVHRLRRERSEDAAHFIRSVSEVFFADMDRSLREMGVGDTGISHRIKKMVEAFYGRLQAYEQNVLNPPDFMRSLKKNLYRDAEISDVILEKMDDYVRRNMMYLDQQETQDILKGELKFLR